MLKKRTSPIKIVLNIVIFFLVIILHTSEALDISIKTATPFLLLPLITAFSFFNPLGACVIAGILSGALIDSVSSGAYCYNTILITILACFVSLASDNLFNKNIQSAAVLSFIVSGVYYVFLWLLFHNFGSSLEDSVGYLLSYAFPSAVYSALFIFPFYYICRILSKIK